MNPQQQAAAVRSGAGLFALAGRGLVAVTGSDRVRWLDGMVSNDVQSLVPGAERSGCYATLLTPQGRIVSDLHVLLRPDAFWLELAAEALASAIERLDRYIVADDVALVDRSAEFARLALEGPAAARILAEVAGSDPSLAADACVDLTIAGAQVLVAAFGWSGEPGFQLFAPPAAAAAVEEALVAAGAAYALVRADAEALEILRIEAGVPRQGRELDDEVLPAEARLDRAVSQTKGCYTGQEVVARMQSRGRVSHLLVGLHFADGAPPEVDQTVNAGEKKVGEVTSACISPAAGAIALAYVRHAHAEPGTSLAVAGREARVQTLPFVSV